MRHRPALRSWNTTTMKKRITMETEKRCLGKLEHHGEFDPEEEQDGLNLYKGLDVYVVPINDREPKTKEYGKLFNDDEFNQYESSNNEDSEGDADADNDKNNNNDDDGAPTADANKKMKVTIKRKRKTKKTLIKEQKKVQVKEQKKVEVKEQKKVELKEQKKTEEGTEESGTEGTEEDRNEGKDDGKEVQDDEKGEKMTGDNKEVAVQMDVDNHNEEKVEKDKEKQDKADKDEFWNTQTDSQIGKLMTQAEIDIKSRKTPKIKSIVEMTPPTFSLGLSPEEPELKSNKKTATNGKTKPDEVMITNYLFSMEGSEFDFIFETKEGNATIRDYMRTLAPNLKIESNVIDTYCLVLNHEQEMDSKGKKTKQFFHTRMIDYIDIISPKANNVPLKEEDHNSWLEFKKLDEGKCLREHSPGPLDRASKLNLRMCVITWMEDNVLEETESDNEPVTECHTNKQGYRVTPPPCMRNPYIKEVSDNGVDPFGDRRAKCAEDYASASASTPHTTRICAQPGTPKGSDASCPPVRFRHLRIRFRCANQIQIQSLLINKQHLTHTVKPIVAWAEFRYRQEDPANFRFCFPSAPL
ncbi:hypothetical protein Tco_0892152 [Tanacetum coccineum]|uniref:Uncharacterized protein n=1 Tax=Tanacetum coccineum TaxID=301880 RepID=A0ABQ5C520_9ASTR